MRNLGSYDSLHRNQLAHARRQLALAQLHNAAAHDADVPAPFPAAAIAELEQALVGLTEADTANARVTSCR